MYRLMAWAFSFHGMTAMGNCQVAACCLADGGSVRVSSSGALVPGAWVGGGLVRGLTMIPEIMKKPGSIGRRPWIAGEISLVDGGLVGVASAIVALVSGGLVGGVILKPKTGTFGWRPRIGGEIMLVDGRLVRGGSPGVALVGGVDPNPKTTMVFVVFVPGALEAGLGGTRISKPATTVEGRCGGGGLVISTLGDGTFVVVLSGRGKAPATATGGPVYDGGFVGCAWGWIALDSLGWAPKVGWAGLDAARPAPSAASITRATRPRNADLSSIGTVVWSTIWANCSCGMTLSMASSAGSSSS